MEPTTAFNGTATSYSSGNGDLSSVVAAGSTDAVIRVKNITDEPLDFHYRKTGSSDDAVVQLLPQTTSGNLWISLTAARTMEYYVSNGEVQVQVVYYFGTGLTAVASVTYTTAAKVAALLRVIDTATGGRLTFSGLTDPKLTEVEEFIREAEDVIDRETNHAWRATTVTNEYHNISGLYTGVYRRDLPVKLQHRSIRAMASGTDKIEYWNGTSWADLVATGTEGRGSDYWVDYTNGIIYFVNKKPYYEVKGVRVTYRYGESSVPGDIQEAATKLAAMKILEDDDYKVLVPEGGTDRYALASKISSWEKRIERILENHRELLLAG